MILCASPEYLKDHHAPNDPDNLKRHQCLCYSTNNWMREWLFVAKDGQPWPVAIDGRFHANNGDVLRCAALQGLGIACLPSFIVGTDVQASTPVLLLPDYVPTDTAIYAAYPHSRHLSPKVRAFIDFLEERYGPRPHWDLMD